MNTKEQGIKRRELLLNFISEHIKLFGYVPSYREMAKNSGLQSVSSVHRQLNILEREGKIIKPKSNISRAIQIRCTGTTE